MQQPDLPRDAVTAPLARHVLFASRDLDEARDRVARVFCPHRLETIGVRARLAARHHHLRGERLSLNYIEYGARTLIDPGELRSFYLLQIPLSGGASIRNGQDSYLSDMGAAAVLNPQRATRMVWDAGTRQVLVQIERDALNDHAALHFGRATGLLTFEGPLDLTRPEGAALRRLIAFVVAEADRGAAPIGSGMMGRQIEAAVMSGLLAAHPAGHAATKEIEPARPRHLRLAMSHIEAHLDQPLTVEDIAAAAGASPRSLQIAFRQHCQATPMGYWRDRRLDQAYDDLAMGGSTVTEVALRWGFTHFGRFSSAFRARHGVIPRDVCKGKQR